MKKLEIKKLNSKWCLLEKSCSLFKGLKIKILGSPFDTEKECKDFMYVLYPNATYSDIFD